MCNGERVMCQGVKNTVFPVFTVPIPLILQVSLAMTDGHNINYALISAQYLQREIKTWFFGTF